MAEESSDAEKIMPEGAAAEQQQGEREKEKEEEEGAAISTEDIVAEAAESPPEDTPGEGAAAENPLSSGPHPAPLPMEPTECNAPASPAVPAEVPPGHRIVLEHHPLAIAASNGETEDFERAYEEAPERLGEKLEWGWTVAHVASACGQDDVLTIIALKDVKKLAERNDYGMTPMHYAASNGQSYALRVLLKYVPECASVKSGDGRTPGDMAKFGVCRQLMKGAENRLKRDQELQDLVVQHRRSTMEKARRSVETARRSGDRSSVDRKGDSTGTNGVAGGCSCFGGIMQALMGPIENDEDKDISKVPPLHAFDTSEHKANPRVSQLQNENAVRPRLASNQKGGAGDNDAARPRIPSSREAVASRARLPSDIV